jgi:hypothetical protein
VAGGYRPNAGRPVGAKDSYPRTRSTAARKPYEPSPEVLAMLGLVPCERMTPLQFLLLIMNDEAADWRRRDAAARALLPFFHPKAGTTEVRTTDADWNRLLRRAKMMN